MSRIHHHFFEPRIEPSVWRTEKQGPAARRFFDSRIRAFDFRQNPARFPEIKPCMGESMAADGVALEMHPLDETGTLQYLFPFRKKVALTPSPFRTSSTLRVCSGCGPSSKVRKTSLKSPEPFQRIQGKMKRRMLGFVHIGLFFRSFEIINRYFREMQANS